MLGCFLFMGKNTFLFVFLRFSLYSVTVRNENCQDEVKPRLSYDNPREIRCKCRAAFWADLHKLWDLSKADLWFP